MVDDGSTLETEALERFVTQRGHRFYRQPRQGPGAARNFGVSQAQGARIAFLDSDDWWLGGKLASQTCLEGPSQVREIWYRHQKRVNPPRRFEMVAGDIFAQSCHSVCVSCSSIVLPRQLFWDLGGFDEKLFVCEDYDFGLRLANQFPMQVVEERLVVRNGGHQDQLSQRFPALDRYRLYALVKLMTRERLSLERFDLALAEAKRKAKILIRGAAKRGGHRDFDRALELLDEEDLTSAFDLCSTWLSFSETRKGQPTGYGRLQPPWSRQIGGPEWAPDGDR